eukprot:scaffold1665_cov67-Phaeocystis_antarctica.AAC.1
MAKALVGVRASGRGWGCGASSCRVLGPRGPVGRLGPLGWRRRLGWPSRIRRWPYAARRTVARGHRATVYVHDRHCSTIWHAMKQCKPRPGCKCHKYTMLTTHTCCRQQRRPGRVPRFLGAYRYRQYTVPLCLGVRDPGIAELRSIRVPVAVPASSPAPRRSPQRHAPRRPSTAPLVGRPPPTGRAPRPPPARPSSEYCTATECHERPRRPRRLVVLRRGQLVGAPLRPLAQLLHQRGPKPAERLDEYQDHAQAQRLRARVVAILRRDVARASSRVEVLAGGPRRSRRPCSETPLQTSAAQSGVDWLASVSQNAGPREDAQRSSCFNQQLSDRHLTGHYSTHYVTCMTRKGVQHSGH